MVCPLSFKAHQAPVSRHLSLRVIRFHLCCNVSPWVCSCPSFCTPLPLASTSPLSFFKLILQELLRPLLYSMTLRACPFTLGQGIVQLFAPVLPWWAASGSRLLLVTLIPPCRAPLSPYLAQKGVEKLQDNTNSLQLSAGKSQAVHRWGLDMIGCLFGFEMHFVN